MKGALTITNGEITSRELTDDLIAELYKIESKSDYAAFVSNLKPPESLKDFRSYIIELFETIRYVQFVIYYKSQLAGTWFVNAYNQEEERCYISLYLLPEYRNSRVSYVVMMTTLEYCFEELSVEEILLEVYVCNSKMRRVLERRGVIGTSVSSSFDEEGVERKKMKYTILKEDYLQYTSE